MSEKEITPKEGPSNFEKVREAYDRQEAEGKVIAEKPVKEKTILEKFQDSLGGLSGEARDETKSRPDKIENEVKRQTGE